MTEIKHFEDITIPRRLWLTSCIVASGAMISGLQAEALADTLVEQDPSPEPKPDAITAEMIRAASWIARVPLTDEHCQQLSKELSNKLAAIQLLRTKPIDENTPMAAVFTPWFFASQTPEENLEWSAAKPEPNASSNRLDTEGVKLPEKQDLESVAFWSVRELAVGLRKGLFTCRQLTEMYLERLKRYDPQLHCVVTLNPDSLKQADAMDAELKRGKDRGPLHGIPWGAKDIIAIPGMPTTWGAIDYQSRERGPQATVANKMDRAGAVLLGKLSVGTLAWGDQWFRDLTRNPWNPVQGSSGSSAGSASAVVAGLCGFALGSETLGSIVSPCRVCSVTGLRPSFGRVSRFGCMTLGWSMDKIGPITRTVDDCGLIFQQLLGMDGLDPTVVERPFTWSHSPIDVTKLRIGVPKRLRGSEKDAAEAFEAAGATMVELEFEAEPRMGVLVDAIAIEAGAMHSQLFASVKSDDQVGKWGPTFREASFCSAMDYVDSMRVRVDLIRATEARLRSVDVLIGDGDLARMNLTGHPSLVVAFGNDEARAKPKTVVLTSRYFSEGSLLGVGAWLQSTLPAIPNMPELTKV
jgi:Asp-tRNA(Asn)/Glu-tRNA(Gln) amidotransferase A subunit family amidase